MSGGVSAQTSAVASFGLARSSVLSGLSLWRGSGASCYKRASTPRPRIGNPASRMASDFISDMGSAGSLPRERFRSDHVVADADVEREASASQRMARCESCAFGGPEGAGAMSTRWQHRKVATERRGTDRSDRLLAALSAGGRSGTRSGFTRGPLTLRPVLACSTANGCLPYGRAARDAALARIARRPRFALLPLALKDPHASRQHRKDQHDATCRPDHLSQHHHVTGLSCRSIALRSRRWARSSVSLFPGNLAREQAARRSSAA
jgi:hypothetical protein